MKEDTFLYPWLSFRVPPVSDIFNAFADAITSHRPLTYAVSIVVVYPVLVSLFRLQRLRWLHSQYDFPTRASMANMTLDQAWRIQKTMAQLEFPFIYIKALQFALFRVGDISILTIRFSLFLTLDRKDIWCPYHLSRPDQNQPIFQPGNFFEALLRHKCLGPGDGWHGSLFRACHQL